MDNGNEIVQFLKGNGVYVPGDTTQLPKEEAKRLQKEGFVKILKFDTPAIDFNPDIKLDLPPQPEANICPICGKKYKTEASLKSHKTKVHKS